MSLNETQLGVVCQRGSNLLVLAGAGTGKTRVITHRIASLVKDGLDPRNILAVTFTNKAAKEMRTRLEKMGVSMDWMTGPWLGTFHSIGLRILKLHALDLGYTKDFSIYDEDAVEAIIKTLVADVRGADKLSPGLVRTWISGAKDSGMDSTGLAEYGLPPRVIGPVSEVFKRYTAELKRANAMDFADLLGNTVRLLRMGDTGPAAWVLRKFKQVLVDEFQDTNRLQMTMVDLISAHSELCVVGDDDQTLYSWRNADPAGMMRFSQRPGVVTIKLETNYRSTGPIIDCANAVIAKNVGRLGKVLQSQRGSGEPVRVTRLLDEKEEATHVASRISGPQWGDHAILYRTHAQSRTLEEALRLRGIPYTIVGGLRFYDRSVIKDMFSYYRLGANPKSDVDLIRIANRPARGIGAKTMGVLKTSATKQGLSMYEALLKSTDPKLGRLRDLLNTIIAATSQPLPDFHKTVLQASQYRVALEDTARTSSSASQKEMAISAIENVDELTNDIASYVAEHPRASLATYLEHVALVSSFDRETGPAVSLMTVHAAKGLEFPRVFLVGCEEGILPHANALQAFEVDRNTGPLEEERRVFYVAVTRAMDRLEMTLTHRRTKTGKSEQAMPSRFLRDLPKGRLVAKGMDLSWWP